MNPTINIQAHNNNYEIVLIVRKQSLNNREYTMFREGKFQCHSKKGNSLVINLLFQWHFYQITNKPFYETQFNEKFKWKI